MVKEEKDLNLLSANLDNVRLVHPRDIVKGKVIKKGEEGYFLNINYKAEGILPYREKAWGKEGEVEHHLEEGEQVWVMVTRIDEQGYVWLSRERARYRGAWLDIEESEKEGKTLDAKVQKRVKGGLVVDIGINAFLPASCVDFVPQKLDDLVGQTIPVKVIEANRKNRNVVVSRKEVLQEERNRKKLETMSSLEIGQIRKGTVKNITKFGAFIDLGGIDGLLHISEVSWGRPGKLENILPIGKEVETKVIAFDPEKEEISLSLKRLTPDPWEKIGETLHQGDLVKGKVVSVKNFGVFVEIEEGVEGLIHVSDLSWGYVKHPQEVVKVGEVVEARVLEIDQEKRRLSLGLKQVYPDPWENIEEKYPVDSIVEFRVSKVNPAGALLELEEGVEGRIPLEELSWKRVNRVNEVLRRNQLAKGVVIELDRDNRQVVVSLKRLRANPWEETSDKWQVGNVVEGLVQRLMNFGAFVELAPEVEALLPLSELDWQPVRHPSQVLKKGQSIQVKIIEFKPDEQRIVVSRKLLLPDPWEEIKNKYPVGSVHSGQVVRIVDFGAFVELEKGWDGLVHISEISEEKVSSPKDVLREKQKVKVKVVKLDDGEKRIGLSIKQAEEEEEKKNQIQNNSSGDGKITLGDVLGEKLNTILNSLKK
ncbi:MAG: small subunit ribosomal protein [Candidatus Atribacteria bacterium]|nr:small subunit ribosomal protein [Candidatus Atribacteria bacterium]